jgi:hypothetical protein
MDGRMEKKEQNLVKVKVMTEKEIANLTNCIKISIRDLEFAPHLYGKQLMLDIIAKREKKLGITTPYKYDDKNDLKVIRRLLDRITECENHLSGQEEVYYHWIYKHKVTNKEQSHLLARQESESKLKQIIMFETETIREVFNDDARIIKLLEHLRELCEQHLNGKRFYLNFYGIVVKEKKASKKMASAEIQTIDKHLSIIKGG